MKTKISVSLRAVIARITRKLKPDMEQLKKCRSPKWESELGQYYTVDLRRNCILDRNESPDKLARKLGVLKPYEKVVA